MSHPDSNIYPTATGPAKALVDAHSGPQPLKLYAGWFCPFVQRVWLVLEEKKLPYQYIEVNPYHKPESLLRLNPRGLVPTLEYEEKPLYESTVICEFLEDAYRDHGSSLRPDDPYNVAKGRIWQDYVDKKFLPAFFRFIQWQPEQSEKSLEEVKTEFHDTLLQFVEAMDPEGPYFFGTEPTLPDFMIVPWAVKLWVFDEFKKGGSGIPEEGQGGKREKTWARWRKWLKVMEARRSVTETLSEQSHYMPLYQR